MCFLFHSAPAVHTSLTMSGRLWGFYWRQDLYPRYSCRHPFTVTFILFFCWRRRRGAPGAEQDVPSLGHRGVVVKGAEGTAGTLTPPLWVNSAPYSRDESSIIEPLFLSHCTSDCDLRIFCVLHVSSQFSTTRLKDYMSRFWDFFFLSAFILII